MFTNNQNFQTRYKSFKKSQKIMQSRLHQDITSLDLSPTLQITFPTPSLQTLHLHLTPDSSSFWKNFKITFQIKIPIHYPNKPPKIKCLNKLFHPNIDDLNGGVCLSIVREDWSPVYGLNHVFQGLLSLFYYFDCGDALHKEAAQCFERDLEAFVL